MPTAPVSSQAVIRATSTDKRRPGSGLSGAFSVGTPNLGESSQDVYLHRSGDSMTGPLILAGNPTQALEPATKTYTDSALSGKVSKAGDTISGALFVTGQVESNNGFKFPDGSIQTSALVGAGVPSGFSILGDTSSPPTGFTFTGLTFIADSWSRKAPMPTARINHAIAVVNGKIYVIGGATASGVSGVNEEFDPTTNTWTTKASMPTSRDLLIAIAVNGKIYAIGGHTTVPVSLNEVYDPVNNSWSTATAMPTARTELAGAMVNGKIYTIGGNDSGGLSDKVEEYDPLGDTWVTKAPMLTARGNLTSSTVNGKIYAVGGEPSATGNINEMYDPSSNTWSTMSSMEFKRLQFGAAAVNGRILAIGGSPSSSSSVELYDPVADSWRHISPLPTPRNKLSAIEAGGKVFAIGGELTDGTKVGVNEVLCVKALSVHKKD